MRPPTGHNGQAHDKAQTPTGGREPARLWVRPAQPGDLVPLTFFFDTMLRNDYFLRRGQLADMLVDKYHQIYVAELDTILVGVAITTRGSQLVNALVHPAYRGLGIGRALLRQSGARTVRAKVDMSSGDPRGFYQALGFESTGVHEVEGKIEVMHARTGAAAKNGNGRARSTSAATGRRGRAAGRSQSVAQTRK